MTKPTCPLKTYEHLTSQERAQIEVLSKEGWGPTRIGRVMGRAKSTISTELRRLGAKCRYSARRAQAEAERLARKARRPVKGTPEMLRELRELLIAGWSPQQIAGRWAHEQRAVEERWSHERLYQLIAAERKAGGTMWQMLRRRGKKVRRDRCGTRRGHRLKVAAEQEIAQRGEQVNGRSETGHWEVDLMIGARQQGVLLVAVERVTLLVRLCSLPSKEAAIVATALVNLLRGERVLSLTYDRGLEWMRHQEVARHFGAQSWFCRPYHSWEKGSVENLNGQLRFYFPKGESFAHEEIDEPWVAQVEAALNGRPRRILDYLTPQEAMRALTGPQSPTLAA